MKIEIKSKSGLRTTLSVTVDKKVIQKKIDEKLIKLQSEVSLKGFRPGKVPALVIKNQFGKAIYGEIIDELLKETHVKALEDKKIKAVGQPKIDLKTFGEGKDLNYEIQADSLPEIKLMPLEKFKATEFKIKIEEKVVADKLKEIASQHKQFSDKENKEKAETGNQVTFNYSATVDGKKFEGSEGKDVKLELGKELFIKGFDSQLLGVKKNDTKTIEVNLPENHPKKELANKKTKFECKILNIGKANDTKIDDNFAKQMGAKDLSDLKKIIDTQISSQYTQALNSITKKEILDQIDKSHNLDLPKNLVENEMAAITQNLKKDDLIKHKNNNEKIAQSRIKIGLILNEYGEKNNLKVSEEDVKKEIQKQIKGMPGQEQMVLDYYQKNPSATQSLKGALYEDKIISLIKSKIKLENKNLSIKEAEKIISNFNKPKDEKTSTQKSKSSTITKQKKNISKK